MELDLRELTMLQALPLDVKIAKSKQRIREAIDYFGVSGLYVPISGGKDSQVLSHLVEQVQIEDNIRIKAIPRVNCNTGNEYDEVLAKARELSDLEVRPTMTHYQVLSEVGYPVGSKMVSRKIRDLQNPTEKNKATRHLYETGEKRDGTMAPRFKLPNKWLKFINSPVRCSEKCCDILKKEPLYRYEKETGRIPFLGVMAAEGGERKNAYLESGCNAFEDEHPKSKPIGFWLDSDILQYICIYGLEIASVYGEIIDKNTGKKVLPLKVRLMHKYRRKYDVELTTSLEKRTGCVCCTFGVTLEKGENRFQRLKKIDPRKYNFCIYGGEIKDGVLVPKNGLGLGYVLDMMGIPYENEFGQIKGQLSIFDTLSDDRILIGDRYINNSNKVISEVFEIDRDYIKLHQYKNGGKLNDIKLDHEWIRSLIKNQTIVKYES